MTIRSFADSSTERVFGRRVTKGFPSEIAKRARDKLVLPDIAGDLEELSVPPGNRLEKLRGDRAGQQSIRINARWRVCFRWGGRNAFDVEVVDYHG